MARGGFRKIEKSLESDAMNEQVHTRLEETRTWDEHEMACGSESEPILLLIAREWKKSRELETFSSLREQPLSSPCPTKRFTSLLFPFRMESLRWLCESRRFEFYRNCFKISLRIGRNFNFARWWRSYLVIVAWMERHYVLWILSSLFWSELGIPKRNFNFGLSLYK